MALPRPFFRLWHTIVDPDPDGDIGTLNKPMRHRTGDRNPVHRLCQQSASREEFVATVIVPSPCDKGEVRFVLVNRETRKLIGGQLRKRTRNPYISCDVLNSRGIPEMFHELCRSGVMIPYEVSLVIPSAVIRSIHTIELRVRRCRIRIASPPFRLVMERDTLNLPAQRTSPSVDSGRNHHLDPGSRITESRSSSIQMSSEPSGENHASSRERLLQQYRSRTEDTKALYEKSTELEARSMVSLPEPTRNLDWRNVVSDAPLLRILTGFSIAKFTYVCSLTCAALGVPHRNRTIGMEDTILIISTYMRHYRPINAMADEFEISRTSFQQITSRKIATVADALESRYMSQRQSSVFSGHYLATVVFLNTEKSQSLLEHERQLGVSSWDPSRNQSGVKFACVFDWEGYIQLVSVMYLGGASDSEILVEMCSSMQDVHIFNVDTRPLTADTSLTVCHNEGGCIVSPDTLTEAMIRCQKFLRQTRESWRCLIDRFRGRSSEANTLIRLCCILQWHQNTQEPETRI